MLEELPSSVSGRRRWPLSVCKDTESLEKQRRRALQAERMSCSALREVVLFNGYQYWCFPAAFLFYFFPFVFFFQNLLCVHNGGAVCGAEQKGDLRGEAAQSWREFTALAPA